MRVLILSDLHLDYYPRLAEDSPEVDAVLLAGDIAADLSAIPWAAERFSGKPVIYVPGNHEFHGWDIRRWVSAARERAQGTQVAVLHGEALTLAEQGGPPVTFLGATLWTDFDLFGRQERETCGEQAGRAIGDFRRTYLNDRLFTWQSSRELHVAQRQWLLEQAQNARRAGHKVVVVSHHAPSPKSLDKRYISDVLSACFVSNLEALLMPHVDLWVHGHIHSSADYQVGGCRVVSNPRGYPQLPAQPGQPITFENPAFNPRKVVNV